MSVHLLDDEKIRHPNEGHVTLPTHCAVKGMGLIDSKVDHALV